MKLIPHNLHHFFPMTPARDPKQCHLGCHFSLKLGSFRGSGGQMGLVRLNGFFASKHMCFIDQSGRDPLFYLDETHMRVTKYCKTHEKRATTQETTPLKPYPNT